RRIRSCGRSTSPSSCTPRWPPRTGRICPSGCYQPDQRRDAAGTRATFHCGCGNVTVVRLDLGSPVRCTDDAFGELADVVIDPTTRRVTHLVVQPHRQSEATRLVPVERARGGDEADGTI